MITWSVKIRVEVTSDDVENIMDLAMRGSSYWCNEAYTEGLEFRVSEALQNGKRIRIHDLEEDRWYILTLKKFLNGVSKMPRHDFYNYDIYDAEHVLQLALFGKLIYG